MDETMSGEPIALKVINKWKIEVSLLEKYFDTWASKNAMQCPHTTTF